MLHSSCLLHDRYSSLLDACTRQRLLHGWVIGVWFCLLDSFSIRYSSMLHLGLLSEYWVPLTQSYWLQGIHHGFLQCYRRHLVLITSNSRLPKPCQPLVHRYVLSKIYGFDSIRYHLVQYVWQAETFCEYSLLHFISRLDFIELYSVPIDLLHFIDGYRFFNVYAESKPTRSRLNR